MNKYQKALNWLVNEMITGRRYKLSDEQKATLLEVFTSHLVLPTSPMQSKGYGYYFDISMNMEYIRKNPIQ